MTVLRANPIYDRYTCIYIYHVSIIVCYHTLHIYIRTSYEYLAPEGKNVSAPDENKWWVLVYTPRNTYEGNAVFDFFW